MAKYKAYPKYKDSGIDWIGDVPEGWEVKPFFALACESKVSNKGMIEDNLLSLSYGNIVKRNIHANEGLLPESFETYQIVEKNNIVFRLTDLQNDQRSLRSAIATERGIITSAYLAIILAQTYNPSFYNYLFRSYDVLKVFYAMGAGLRQSLKYSDLKHLQLLTPSLKEQQTIATFLDRETAHIDALIVKKERSIELLKEKRQATITHAVTKGLNPLVKMKDSGIEWIGEVPEDWIICPLKHRTKLVIDGSHFTPTYVDEGIPFLRVTDISSLSSPQSQINWQRTAQIPLREHIELSKRCNVEKGDLLVSKNGTIGVPKVVDWDFPVSLFVSLCLIKVDACSPFFLYYYFKSFLPTMEIVFKGKTGTITNLHLEMIKEFKIPFPPLQKQQAIVDYLDTQCAKLDTLISKTQSGIELLKEKRTALITAAVTGKIDVREAVC